MDFSPRHAETLQLSPSHHHSIGFFHDELKSLRRGISRSPSKISRIQRSSPSSPSKHSPLSQQFNIQATASPISRTPRDVTAPSTSRKARSSLARAAPMKSNLFTPRPESSSQQNGRRPLSIASGNSSSQSSQEHIDGQENQSTTPQDAPWDGNIFSVARSKAQDSPFPMPAGRPKSIAVTEREFLRERAPVKSSPLKRNDGLMNLDQPSFGSPSAKRRSLHGAPFEIAKDVEMKTDWNQQSDEDSDPDYASFRSTFAPRASRKPHGAMRVSDRANTARNRRSLELDFGTPASRRTAAKNKSRASIDGTLALRNDTADTISSMGIEQRPQFARPARAQPHPLSKALTPASPLEPQRVQGLDRAQHPPDTPEERPSFSKSLPIGALRPHLRQTLGRASGESSAIDTTFATPKPFDDARPDPAAFRSTGLISKRHRDPDDMPPPPGGHNAMPDTPCKKMSIGVTDHDSPTADTNIIKPRFTQPLFGTPARPLDLGTCRPQTNLAAATATLSPEGEHDRLTRSTSFVSNDDSDCGRSPNGSHGQGESHSSADELPPTPTKQMFGLSTMKTSIKNSSLRSSLFGRRTPVGPRTFSPQEATEDISRDQHSTRRLFTQSLSLPPSGPAVPPQTPAELGFPDPSQLSISPTCRGTRTPSWRSSLRSSLSKPPETPSSHREQIETDHPIAVLKTPSHGVATGHDIDPILSERFKKVTWLGRGEFSEVFKVHQGQQRAGSGSHFSPSNMRNSRTSHTPLPDAVFVVKKTKTPLHGSRIRERTIREARIMQALGRNEHVVQLIDSWEARSHLYLMTEYCEEGTLDSFLRRTGRDGRLDDFRIWKIMLEVGAGLKHIHDVGFMHLDLKPENIFIDFSGTLKIGDFGLACEWPAPKSVEGEGDRRYIGPDLLMGKFDKPADIFAFGMMMYEIAGNFVPPDNGTNWHKLRSGDFSGLPSLTSGSSNSLSAVNSGTFGRNDSYDNRSFSPNTVYSSRPDIRSLDTGDDTHMGSSESLTTPRVDRKQSGPPPTELAEPPAFMSDPYHPASLDNVVHWMMLPSPQERPVIDQVLDVSGCRWVSERRRAGAVVREGAWGPSDAVLTQNTALAEASEERRLSGINQDAQMSQGTFLDDADAEMMDA